MKRYFVDLHIHVGATEEGQWVKIPTSRHLTVRNICEHSLHQKGMDIIGLADAMSPLVLKNIEKLINEGLLVPLAGGGYCYDNRLTVLLGAEIETTEPKGGMSHTLFFLPDLAAMRIFAIHMGRFIKNINLSAQNARMSLASLVDIAAYHEALIIPAHVFTPYKSIYGAAAERISHLLRDNQMTKIAAIELGLSSDTYMADRIEELSEFTFVTHSDAHSLDKIAREYTWIKVDRPDFTELNRALFRQIGRKVVGNFGLDPRLGKYHRTFCEHCGHVEQTSVLSISSNCINCGSNKIVKGVLDRINEIADYDQPCHPDHRPPYQYQVPLEFIPGLGKKTLKKLLDIFGTEMNVLHNVNESDLCSAIGEQLATRILTARSGSAAIQIGGGGIYGKVL